MKRTLCFIVLPFAVACATASGTAPPDMGARQHGGDAVTAPMIFPSDEEFGVEPGVNDLEGGLRLRDEIWRKVASSVVVAYRSSLGATRDRIAREGGVPNPFFFAAGVRAWR